MSSWFRALLALAVVLAFGACGDEGPADDASSADRVAFTTELIHRDAATLVLLDASLGKPLPPKLATAVETVRLDATSRIEAAKDLLEEWGEEVPVTIRDHGVDHGVEVDAPEFPGAPTEEQVQALAGADDWRARFTDLLRESLSSTEEAAAAWDGDDPQATELADNAETQARGDLRRLPTA